MAEQNEKQDNVKFEEAIEIAGYGKFNVFIIWLSGIIVTTSLLSSMDVSYLMPVAGCDFQLTSQDKGLLGSAYFIGIISSSHLSGFIADTLGRKYVLVRGLFLNVLIYIFGALAPTFWTFFILKVLSGVVTCPCMIATYPLLGEYMPAKKRSQALMITVALSNVGLLYSCVIGWVILNQDWSVDLCFVTFTPWRLFYLLCGLPGLLAAIMLYLTPESPKFLLTRGKKGDTMKVLQRVHSLNSGNTPQSFPVQSVSIDADETVPPVRGKGAVGALKHVCQQTIPLLRAPYLRNLSLCVIMYFSLFFCVNSIFLWLPEIMNRMVLYKDVNESKFHLCQMIMKDSTTDNTTNTTDTVACDSSISRAVFLPNIFISIGQPLFMLATSVVIPYMDRRTVFMLVMIVCSVMSFFVTRVPDMYIIFLLFGGIVILTGVSFNILTSILIELFPTYIRAMAVSFAMIFGRAGSIAGSHTFSSLIDTHCSLLFMIVSGILFCCSAVPFYLQMKKQHQPPKQDLPPAGDKM